MENEKRLIDANALKIHRMYNAGANHPLDAAYRKDIDNAPTVDAVEVVRCKDCKHWKRCYKLTKPNELSQCGSCGLISMDVYMDEGDFCSYGERKAK